VNLVIYEDEPGRYHVDEFSLDCRKVDFERAHRELTPKEYAGRAPNVYPPSLPPGFYNLIVSEIRAVVCEDGLVLKQVVFVPDKRGNIRRSTPTPIPAPANAT
jgi:hypothetical protein